MVVKQQKNKKILENEFELVKTFIKSDQKGLLLLLFA